MNSMEHLQGKKVLHVLRTSIPVEAGYTIRAKHIVKFQKKMGIDPIVITSPLFEDRDVAYEEIEGIPYHRTNNAPSSVTTLLKNIPFLGEQLRMQEFRKRIRQVAQKYRVDIIHAHSPSLCGIPALKAARDLNLPMAYEVRALWEDAAVDRKRFKEGSLKYRVSQIVEQRLFDRADMIIPICRGLKDEIHQRSGKDNISIVGNGVDTGLFLPRETNTDLLKKLNLEGEVVVGFIGSFFTFEGLEDLVKSVPLVLENQSDVTFLLVGSGVEDENLRKLSSELGLLDKKIIFTGRVPHGEVIDYYSICDVLVYPRKSLRITELVTPLKPLEAMSMEKAVIGSNVGGLKELIDDQETGLLYESENVDDLSAKILSLTADAEKRAELGKKARQRMIEARDWSEVAKSYAPIYEKMLAGKSKS